MRCNKKVYNAVYLAFETAYTNYLWLLCVHNTVYIIRRYVLEKIVRYFHIVHV